MSDQYRKVRGEKAARLRELGVDPFGAVFAPSHTVAAARALAPSQGEGDEQPRGDVVMVAGRIGNIRKAGGKLRFATLFDRSRADLLLEQRRSGLDDVD
ncbi:MAG: hypothetical protein ACYTF0_06720, partial [Planctomycetota bacterium]